jgi:hypothetical protein
VIRSLFDIRLQPLRNIEMYGPHGILSEGRLFEIGEKTGVESCERSEGKIGKSQSWKYAFECQNCGKRCAGRSGEKNRFCRNECQQEFQVRRWFACSCCLAKIGLGGKMAGKILGLNGTSIIRQWKARGIVAKKPKSGSWFAAYGEKTAREEAPEQAKERQYNTEYRRARMADIRDAFVFPDWSSLAKKPPKSYHNLTVEEKRKRNDRCLMLRKARENVDLSLKKIKQQRINEWKRDNPEKVKGYMKKHFAIPKNKIGRSMRGRFKEIMESARVGGTDGMWSLIGCSSAQLAIHLQSKFKRGMTWANYGSHWHVDHVLPCASFDQQDPRQRAQCWHWTNLEPLEASKNLSKSDKITKPQMQLLLCATH